MKNVIELITHKRAWGRTSSDVFNAAQIELSGLNTPAPFQSLPDKPDMPGLAVRMQEACDKATTSRRKGMMISSRFRVEYVAAEKSVKVYHVRNEYEPELFIELKAIQQQ